jgi:hypothetical protein
MNNKRVVPLVSYTDSTPSEENKFKKLYCCNGIIILLLILLLAITVILGLKYYFNIEISF